ncbi:MAG: hypothetical protein AAGK14_08935 [Verrucomicrobiota bacterium]
MIPVKSGMVRKNWLMVALSFPFASGPMVNTGANNSRSIPIAGSSGIEIKTRPIEVFDDDRLGDQWLDGQKQQEGYRQKARHGLFG